MSRHFLSYLLPSVFPEIERWYNVGEGCLRLGMPLCGEAFIGLACLQAIACVTVSYTVLGILQLSELGT